MTTPRLTSGGKNRADGPTVQAGGGGINVARGIRRLGGSALAVHTRGREIGHYLDRLLDEEGIPHRGVDIDRETRTAFVVAEEWTGHSYHIVPPGPELTETDERRLLETICREAAGCRYLVLTGSPTPRLREDFCAEIIRSLADTDTRILLDVTAPQLRKALTNEVFLIRLDRATAEDLTGTPIETFEDARAANEHLLDIGATANAVTTVGALGAVYSTPRAHHELPAPALVDGPRSDACAGDSLVAALTHHLTLGTRLEEAAAFAVAAAAATVALRGTQMFTRAEVERLRAAMPAGRRVAR
nr:PfkB family carbohydrate kinase [Nocardia bovistercoris]